MLAKAYWSNLSGSYEGQNVSSVINQNGVRLVSDDVWKLLERQILQS